MSKQIHYSDEPIGNIKLVPDFLPSPQDLALKNEQTKVTISLSSESVNFFKTAARRHHMQYQKMIRQLLDGGDGSNLIVSMGQGQVWH